VFQMSEKLSLFSEERALTINNIEFQGEKALQRISNIEKDLDKIMIAI